MLANVPNLECHIGKDTITSTDSARNVGAVFNDTMSMKGHIAQICKGPWHYLLQIGQIGLMCMTSR